MWILAALPAFAGKWDNVPSDVAATKEIPAPPEAVMAAASDLKAYAELFPPDCASEWELQERTAAVGARGQVTYTIGPMRRRLVVVISKDEPGLFELDHEGKKGFFTQLAAVPSAVGSAVSLTTFLEQPPWPFRGVFHQKVQPAWTSCHVRTLEALAGRLARPADP